MKSKSTLGALQVFVGGSSYGIMATTYKLAFAQGFSWQLVVVTQGLFAVVAFAVALAVRMARRRPVERLNGKRIARLMGLGALTACTGIFYSFSMTLLPVSVALTLLFQFTWIGLVIQVIITRRAPRPAEVAAAAVIFAGTFFASGAYHENLFADYSPLGIACALVAAVCCASFVALSGRVETELAPEQRGLFVCLGTFAVGVVICPLFPQLALQVGFYPLFGVVMGVFGVFFPVLLFGLGGRHISAGMSTIMASAELPIGLLVSMFVLAEPVTGVQWVGVALILSGVVVSQLGSLRSGRCPA